MDWTFAPKHYETKQNISLVSNGVDRVHSLRKIWTQLRGTNFCINCTILAPFQLILHRVSCSNEMVPNAPEHYDTQQKMSLGSNGVDWVRSLWKHLMRLCGTNFCINCTISAHFALSLLP